MAVHVAILLPQYVDLILRGVKTVESRLYRSAMPPIGCARVGERVYIKQSGGPFRAMARIKAIDEHRDLTPRDVDALARRYNESVCGDPEYWKSKRGSRFASFITLSEVEPIDVGPCYAKSMRAWHTLANEADVIFDLGVSSGGLRNRYLSVPAACGFAKHHNQGMISRSRERLELVLPDSTVIDTNITTRGYFRWRGWGRYYEQHRMSPGDRVRLIALGGRRYRVCFVKRQES